MQEKDVTKMITRMGENAADREEKNVRGWGVPVGLTSFTTNPTVVRS